MACVMRSTYLSFRPIMFSSPVEKERAQVLFVFFFFFFLRVVVCVSSLVFFFFFLAASSITYLSALRFPYREGVEGGFVFFFFFQHTCCTLCRFLLPSPIEKACVCLWVGRGWGCIP